MCLSSFNGWKLRHQRLWPKGLISPLKVLNATCWMRASLGHGLVSCCDDMCHVPLMGVKLGLLQTRLRLRKLFFIMSALKVTGDEWRRVNSCSRQQLNLKQCTGFDFYHLQLIYGILETLCTGNMSNASRIKSVTKRCVISRICQCYIKDIQLYLYTIKMHISQTIMFINSS